MIDILKKIEMFSSLDDLSLQELKDQMKPVFLKKDELLCSEGDHASSMYVVESGEISILKNGKDAIPVEVARLLPGEVAGIMSIFGDDTRSATMKTASDVKLWEIKHNDFQQLLERNPAIGRNMLQVLSRYLREKIQMVADFQTRDIDSRLKVAVFDSKPYTRETFIDKNAALYALKFFDTRLNEDTAIIAEGFKVICAFVNDTISAPVVKILADTGVEMIAMRCAGYNNVDLKACRELGISVANVPAYSPHAVAEHAVTMMLTLNRRITRAHNRVREGNFSLNGLVGFDMYRKKAGVIGAGKIGMCAINILAGFGCDVLVYDPVPKDFGLPNVRNAELDELFSESDIITLHTPLFAENYHIINDKAIARMKDGVMIINTSRGALIDSHALTNGILSGKIGSAGLDVYEEEKDYFYEDYSDMVVKDEILGRLITFHNVLITGHMAFLTKEALLNIAEITINNIREYEGGRRFSQLTNSIKNK